MRSSGINHIHKLGDFAMIIQVNGSILSTTSYYIGHLYTNANVSTDMDL